MYLRALLICIGCGILFTPAHAQNWKKAAKALQAQSGNTAAQFSAYEHALRHAQALQELKLTTQGKVTSLSQKTSVSLPSAQLHFRRTPQEWLNMLEKFTQNTGRFPSYNNPHEKALYGAIRNMIYRLDEQDPVLLRVQQIQAQYPARPSHRPGKTPQEWLTELEAFIAQNDRFPTPSTDKILYAGIYSCLYRLDKQDPVALRMRELYEQYAWQVRHPARSPQEWLAELEDFVDQYQRYPMAYKDPHERAIHVSIYRLQKILDPNDPIVLRIEQIQQQYPIRPSRRVGKTPQDWLTELEAFIRANHTFPSATLGDPMQKNLYVGVFNALSRLSADDPVALRIRELRAQYLSQLQKK